MGSYTGGRLEGQAKMVMVDGTCRHCWVQRGWLHGPCRWSDRKLDPLSDSLQTFHFVKHRGVRQDGEQKLAYLGHYAGGAPRGGSILMDGGSLTDQCLDQHFHRGLLDSHEGRRMDTRKTGLKSRVYWRQHCLPLPRSLYCPGWAVPSRYPCLNEGRSGVKFFASGWRFSSLFLIPL